MLACVWDFDKTLCPGYMQTPLFSSELFLDGEFAAAGGLWGVRVGVPLSLGIVGGVRYTTTF